MWWARSTRRMTWMMMKTTEAIMARITETGGCFTEGGREGGRKGGREEGMRIYDS